MTVGSSQAIVADRNAGAGAEKIPASNETVIPDSHDWLGAVPVVDIDPGALANNGMMTDAHLPPAKHLGALVHIGTVADVAAAKVVRLTQLGATIPPASGAPHPILR
jgi:hypothetical protein